MENITQPYPQGDTGPQGIQGIPGEFGHTGPQGIQGNQGIPGEIGHTGPQGIQGIQGIAGDIGHTGPQGIPGEIGTIGPTGPIGFTGPQCENMSTFINLYSIKQQNIQQNQSISFDTFTACVGDCCHYPNTSEIWIWKSGYYFISANVNQLQAGKFSLFKNGVVIHGSSYGSLTGSALQITCIFNISMEDINIENAMSPTNMACKIEIVNNSDNYPFITIYSYEAIGNNVIAQNSASIAVMLIK